MLDNVASLITCNWIEVWSCVIFAASLRALYLADNEFEIIPPEVSKLHNLQIVSQISFLF